MADWPSMYPLVYLNAEMDLNHTSTPVFILLLLRNKIYEDPGKFLFKTL
jgi:hypothetical protein